MGYEEINRGFQAQELRGRLNVSFPLSRVSCRSKLFPTFIPTPPATQSSWPLSKLEQTRDLLWAGLPLPQGCA